MEGSILSPGARAKRGAQVLNSIILHDGDIGAGAVPNRVILDKKVVIGGKGSDPRPIRGPPTGNSRAHLSEGITLVGKKAFIPSGSGDQRELPSFPRPERGGIIPEQ